MTNEEFQENLRIGTEAENKVYAWLRMNYSFVQDMRYQKHEKGTGPRLEGLGGSVVLPDFAYYDKIQGNYLLDVKYKSKNYFTVDEYKMRDYLKAVDLLGMDGLLLVFVFQNEMYFYDSLEKQGPVAFNNSYGTSAYTFRFDKLKIKK
jgi:hypothetical protein